MGTLTLRADGKTLGEYQLDPKTLAVMRKERALGIWKQLVQYVQADLNQRDEVQNFRSLILECMAWNGLIAIPEDEIVAGRAAFVSTILAGGKRSTIINKDPFKLCSDGLTAEEGAIKYQKDFLPVLKWLARNPELGGEAQAQIGMEAVKFLWEHGEKNIGLKVAVHKDRALSFFTRQVEKYGTIASPICRFILDRLDYYAQADDKSDIIPLKVCAWCPKIMYFERSSRKTCSDSCRVAMSRKGL